MEQPAINKVLEALSHLTIPENAHLTIRDMTISSPCVRIELLRRDGTDCITILRSGGLAMSVEELAQLILGDWWRDE